ncbi:MAG: hypothetical protein M0Q92_01790 [Methanoregula sp.]|jgi:hypothetical protein|nr:hypothetical protein [Methanoregula sp.]
MTLTVDQELVLKTIFNLGKGSITTPVTIGAIHHSFSDMDVRDLVTHLQALLDAGLIENYGKTMEKISNTFIITPKGISKSRYDDGSR